MDRLYISPFSEPFIPGKGSRKCSGAVQSNSEIKRTPTLALMKKNAHFSTNEMEELCNRPV